MLSKTRDRTFINWRARWLAARAPMLATRVARSRYDVRVTLFWTDDTISESTYRASYSKETNQFWVADLCEFIADPELRRHFLAGRMKEFM